MNKTEKKPSISAIIVLSLLVIIILAVDIIAFTMPTYAYGDQLYGYGVKYRAKITYDDSSGYWFISIPTSDLTNADGSPVFPTNLTPNKITLFTDNQPNIDTTYYYACDIWYIYGNRIYFTPPDFQLMLWEADHGDNIYTNGYEFNEWVILRYDDYTIDFTYLIDNGYTDGFDAGLMFGAGSDAVLQAPMQTAFNGLFHLEILPHFTLGTLTMIVLAIGVIGLIGKVAFK